METFLIRALQLIMSLSLLVIIHEGGHFLFIYLRHEWKNSVCSLTRVHLCSNSNRKTVKRNMVSAGCL